MTVAIAKTAFGNSYIVHNLARNSAGTQFTVSNSAENSAGAAFLIFGDSVVITPPTGQKFTVEDERYFWA